MKSKSNPKSLARVDELKAQLAQLEALIAAGTLKGEKAKKERNRLEAEILAAVLRQPAGADADPPPARPSGALLAGMTLFVVAFAAAGYAKFGKLDGLDYGPGITAAAPAAAEGAAGHAQDSKQFEAMAERLAERLKTRPDDAEGWTMLARSYAVIGQFDKAVEAFQHVLKLKPKDAQLLADYADMLSMANGRKLEGEPEKLVAEALKIDPTNVKALSLAGTIAFDKGDAATAARHWEKALNGADVSAELAQQLQGALDEARSRAGLPPLPHKAIAEAAAPAPGPATDASPPVAPAVAAGPGVKVSVSLAPALAGKASPDDTLFVFARAPEGSKAPLAIQRLQVKNLPLQLTLDDSTAMNPAMKVSGFKEVVVGARISKTGQAMPQPGDLQGVSKPVPVGGAKPVELVIGEQVR